MKRFFALCVIVFLTQGGCVTPKPTTETTPPSPQVPTISTSNPMIHTDGVRIVDGKGQPVKLRGTIIEGWLMWNGPLWGTGLTSETTITNRLESLVGKEETALFRQKVYENFITEGDIKKMSELGFNVVRIPFNHTVFEDDSKPYVYKASGWKYMDAILDWCEKYKVYAVIDFHSLPGGQSGVFVCDPDFIKLWANEENMKRTLALWKAIATRYKDRQIVAGYDLINEPGPPNHSALIDAYQKIINVVRAVDPHHMIILEGGDFASNDFSMFDKPLCDNQVFSFHSYNLFGKSIGEDVLQKHTEFSNTMNAPLWNGEFGAHTAAWLKEIITYYEKPDSNVNGWIYWPWKRVPENDVDRYRVLMTIHSTPKWDKVRYFCASLFGLGKKPSREEALEGMAEFIEAMKIENNTLDYKTMQVLNSYKK